MQTNSGTIPLIILIFATICELCFAEPDIRLGSHTISLKRPSFHSKSQRSSSNAEMGLDNSGHRSKSRFGAKKSHLSQSKSLQVQELESTGSTRHDMTNSAGLLNKDCSYETFDVLNNIENLDEIDNMMRRSDLDRCVTFLLSQLMSTLKRAQISAEQEQVLAKFRRFVEESDDNSDFDTNKLYQHVPKINLSLALISYAANLKKLTDPRSEIYNFNERMREIYKSICEPIGSDEFLALMRKFDILDKVLYSRDPNMEVEDTLASWMSNIRICSYMPKEELDDLIQSTNEMLTEQLGKDQIEDPEEE